MNNSSKAVDVLTKMITEAARGAAENASYDKTTFGIIKGKIDGAYTVFAFGQDRTINSSQDFKLHERVAVTAPQCDYSNLIIHKI